MQEYDTLQARLARVGAAWDDLKVEVGRGVIWDLERVIDYFAGIHQPGLPIPADTPTDALPLPADRETGSLPRVGE